MNIIEFAQSDLYHKCGHNDDLLERLRQEPDYSNLEVTPIVIRINAGKGKHDVTCSARCRRVLRPYRNSAGLYLKHQLPRMAFIEKEQW